MLVVGVSVVVEVEVDVDNVVLVEVDVDWVVVSGMKGRSVIRLSTTPLTGISFSIIRGRRGAAVGGGGGGVGRFLNLRRGFFCPWLAVCPCWP